MPVRRHLVPLLIFAAGYALLVWPVLPFFPTHIFQDGGDGLQNLWNNWWVRHALAHGQSPLQTDHLFHPQGVSLAGATLNPFNGLCTVVLCQLVDQVVAFNLMVVFAFVATGYFTYLLARELSGAVWPSVFAGAVFTFCTFHTAHASSHMQLVSVQFLPLFVLLWIRLLRQPGYSRALLAAMALCLVLLCDYYYTMYAVMLGVLLFVTKAVVVRRPLFFLAWNHLLPLSVFVAACVLFCGPMLIDLALYIRHEELLNAHDSNVWRNDLLSPFIPGSPWAFHASTEWYWSRHPLGDQYPELGAYLGWTVILLSLYALWAGWRTRRSADVVPWLLIGALFFALSLGNELLLLGTTYPDVPTPHGILEAMFPFLAVGGMPMRMVVVTHLCAAVLAGFGMRDAWQRLPRLRVLLVPFLVAYAIEIWPRTQRIAQPELTPVIEQLRDLPAGSVTGLASLDPSWLYYQTIFRKPITGGYVARWPRRLEPYRRQQDALREKGDYAALRNLTGATYVLVDRIDAEDRTVQELKLIGRDHRFDLYAAPDSDLPEFDPASYVAPDAPVRVGTRDSTWVEVEIQSPSDAGCSFVCAASMQRTRAGALTYGHRLEVVDDGLFRLAMNPANEVFVGCWGRLDRDGRAVFKVRQSWLKDVPDGRVYFTLIVFHGDLIGQVRRIHRPVRVDLKGG